MVILLDVLKATFAKQSHASQEASMQKRRNKIQQMGRKKEKKPTKLLIMAQKAGKIKLLTEKNDRHLSSESTGHRKEFV